MKLFQLFRLVLVRLGFNGRFYEGIVVALVLQGNCLRELELLISVQ
jgi:hypothetical protein